MTAQPDIGRLVAEEQKKLRLEQASKNGHAAVRAGSEFAAIGDDLYRLSLPAIGVTFEVDRLRREHGHLTGELSVQCELPGALTFNGSLSLADLNLSSAKARQEHARLLAMRAKTGNKLDWTDLMEEFCQRVLRAERTGQPAIDLRLIERPDPKEILIEVGGFALPRKHPTIIFGDGGTAKSYLALYLAGCMAEIGMSVALFDWELDGAEHRDRLERLFPHGMPRIVYARCDRPLFYEVDRLRRIVRENSIAYSVFDSVAFACDGPPEAAEVAGRYFRAVRQIGGGSLHIAHVTKGEHSDQKPFGSVFWHNGARATWYVKQDESSADTDVLRIGLFNRKVNLGRLRQPIGYSIAFGEGSTTVRRTNVADSPGLVGQLNVRQRIVYLLHRGALAPEKIAEEVDADLETVKRTIRRHKKLFVVLEDGRIALLESRRG